VFCLRWDMHSQGIPAKHRIAEYRLLLSLQNNHTLPFPYFQAMTEKEYFPLYSGIAAVLMGCSLPIVDYYHSKYLEEQRWRTKDENQENRPLWERAEWSMPMRYIGGVVGFAWAASVRSITQRF
jgi:hypothetical protein